MAKDTLDCSRCNEVKPKEEFYARPGIARGYRYECKECSRAKLKKDYSENPEVFRERRRRSFRKTKYGIEQAEYDRLMQEQDGACAICASETNLVIDHCHETGKVRGLLCNSCNKGLGFFGDNDLLLRAAGGYLYR